MKNVYRLVYHHQMRNKINVVLVVARKSYDLSHPHSSYRRFMDSHILPFEIENALKVLCNLVPWREKKINSKKKLPLFKENLKKHRTSRF